MKEFNITVSETNNPTILKFETNHMLTKGKNYEYSNIDEAKNSPLAQQLFYLPFIKTVYISGNFIGLERYAIVEWSDVKDEVAQQLVEYLNAGEPVVIEEETSKIAGAKFCGRFQRGQCDSEKFDRDEVYRFHPFLLLPLLILTGRQCLH